MQQTILIRGHNKNYPVLLWLHGGPGSSQIPLAHQYDKELEKNFIVVHWDQRGSGKSNPENFNEETMTYEQFISDGYELTQYLKQRLGKKKIYLLGHSWGTQLGLELAGRHPEDYYAYIGVSQVVNQGMHHKIAYSWLLEKFKNENNKKGLKELDAIGQPPFSRHSDFIKLMKLVNSNGGSFDIPFSRLALISLKAPEYNMQDYSAWLRGAKRGSGRMWQEEAYYTFNAIDRYPELKLPVYFFTGKNDYNTPLESAEKYYNHLSAPAGKKMVIFENSAHTPFFGEPEKFLQEMIRVKNETSK